MYKTTWIIKDLEDNTKTELTWYHFGKQPKFPTWYMEANKAYEIEMLWNHKLILTINILIKCLTHAYIIK